MTFEAELDGAITAATHVRDALAMLGAGLATGISPGFRLPPERAVPKEEAEEWIDEEHDPANDMHRAKIRRIKQALLFGPSQYGDSIHIPRCAQPVDETIAHRGRQRP